MKWPIFGKKPLNILLWNQKAKLNLVLVCSIRDVSASNFSQMMNPSLTLAYFMARSNRIPVF